MADKIKLGEISKNLKITNKDIIAKLAEFGVELKSSASVVDEETIGLIFDIYTEMNQVSEEEIREMREAALKKAREDGNDEEKPAKKPAKKTEEKAEKPAKKEEKKAEEKPVKEVKKTEEKTEVKAEVKTETKAEKKEEKQKQEKHKKVAKKQSGQRIDLSNIDHTNTEEEYVVKTEEKKRYVDTRQSTVELDTIESRERIEDMVPDNIKMDKKGGKAKNKKGGKNRREKEKNQQPKKEIKAKVITEVEIPETITVGEFASKMGKTSAEVVKKLMMLGVMASQNQAIDFETAQLIGDDFGIEVKQEVVLTKDDLLIDVAKKDGYVTEEDNYVTVVLDTNLTPELIEEGFVREVISKIQTMRKEAGFEVMDHISVYQANNDKIAELMKSNADEIKNEVMADHIHLGEMKGFTKEWNINGETVMLGVEKL